MTAFRALAAEKVPAQPHFAATNSSIEFPSSISELR